MRREMIDIATDLSANLAAEDRYRRLVRVVRDIIPCDSAALMSLDGGELVPLATEGLRADAEGHRFRPGDHPRLARILESPVPIRFTGSDLPDPFDGLLDVDADASLAVHACMGCRLSAGGRVIGALAVDALDPHAFDRVLDEDVAALAALAGAAMHTALLISALEESCRRQGLVASQLRAELQARGGDIIGQSHAIRKLRHEIDLAGDSNLTVLITGETGVGKELVARALHRRSSRRDHPMIYVNCAALPESIAESELFGHVRGAFTGAHDSRPGRFEAAEGGTLFLDEIGELPLAVQPKLLRVLQEGEIQRVGSDRTIRVDARIVAATNRDLADEVGSGHFRQDLYHRLSVYPIHVPPLRERLTDVPLLAGYFLDRTRTQLGLGSTRITPAALEILQAYDWPGNVRELEHVLMRAALRASGGRRRERVIVDAAHLGLGARSPHAPEPVGGAPVDGLATFREMPLAEATDAFRRRLIEAAVEEAGGNWSAAARRLGVNRGNLHRLGKRLGLIA